MLLVRVAAVRCYNQRRLIKLLSPIPDAAVLLLLKMIDRRYFAVATFAAISVY